jgi:lipopolysaccharide export system protein LptC
MARADNRYSVFVGTAKIILPILGLGLLSTLFLLPDSRDDTPIPYSEVELNEIIEGQRIAEPDFQTVTENGSTVSIVADSARPDILNPDVFRGKEVIGQMITPEGDVIDVRSAEGSFDRSVSALTLTGGLRAAHSNGFVMAAPGGRANLDANTAETDGSTLVTGPEIKLTAGKATIDGTSEVVVFSEGVKLIYTPE